VMRSSMVSHLSAKSFLTSLIFVLIGMLMTKRGEAAAA
jgi:hypothetical protein